MSTGALFLWRWARLNPFMSPSRVQIHGIQVCTRALRRCSATNTRTVAHSQYFSFSLCTPSARCAVTFQASRASRDVPVRSHMMGKYRSPGDCWYKMSGGRGKSAAALSWLCADPLWWDFRLRGVLSCYRMTTVIFSLSLFPVPVAAL